MRPPYDDYCYECGGYGDDCYIDDDGEMKRRCSECPYCDREDALGRAENAIGNLPSAQPEPYEKDDEEK